jgi:hypothetical protein
MCIPPMTSHLIVAMVALAQRTAAEMAAEALDLTPHA